MTDTSLNSKFQNFLIKDGRNTTGHGWRRDNRWTRAQQLDSVGELQDGGSSNDRPHLEMRKVDNGGGTGDWESRCK